MDGLLFLHNFYSVRTTNTLSLLFTLLPFSLLSYSTFTLNINSVLHGQPTFRIIFILRAQPTLRIIYMLHG